MNCLFRRLSPTGLRSICFVFCFGLIFSGIPVIPATIGAGKPASKSKVQLIQSAPGPNLPNLNEARLLNPGSPKAPSPVSATRCRYRDLACKLAKGEISSNQPQTEDNGIDRLLARLVYPSWFNSSAKFKDDNRLGLTGNVNHLGGHHSPGLSNVSPMTTGALSSMQSSWAMAMLNHKNDVGAPGEDLLSGNYNWSLPLVSLPGRAGHDLNLGLSLNSLIWTKDGSIIHFDLAGDFPAIGFRLGFPEILTSFTNTEAGTASYLVIMPSGQRVEFRQIGTNLYETQDSTYLRLTYDPASAIFTMVTTDGTRYKLQDALGIGKFRCIEMKDRNGNYISVAYNSFGEISNITDTLSRVVNFNYDGFSHLNSITQTWDGETHTWATFGYSTQAILTNFPGLTLSGISNGSIISVLNRIGLADGSVYSFEYNTYGQVKTIRRYAPSSSNPESFPADYTQRSYIAYNLPADASAAQTNCPRFTTRTNWAQEWNSGVTTTFATDPGYAWGQVTTPDGVIYKEFFGTTGWQRGLTLQTETWSGDVKKKWTTLQLTQDNTEVSYLLNPRVTETNIYDDADNRRRATISYTSFGLPSDVYEYAADATTVLRRTHTDYNLSAVYTDRRIIGLPIAQYLYDGSDNLFSKVDYRYDLGGEHQVHQGPPVRHDTANYGAGFVQGRGNLNSMRRWDVTDANKVAKVSEYKTGYNTSGSVIFTRDPLNHQTSFSYTDSFSDQVNHNTLAYPTTVTDPDSNSSTVQYNYDFGAVTRTQDPKGAAVTRTYDPAGRIDRITNQINSAYTRFVYALNQSYMQSFTTIDNISSEAYQIAVFDGHNRLRAVGGDHPTSVSGHKMQYNVYNEMGRLIQQTNPTEVNASWEPSGDDALGYASTSQAYDWQGRPTVSTNQDGTTREISYGGCGCAGGLVATATDEMGRKRKIYLDVLGREAKIEALNWNDQVYSTQINTYNVRDQITQISQIAGTAGASQVTTNQYDGHGRLWKARQPIETGDTVYEYYKDDTVQKITDARQAAATFTYYNRHLTQDIAYTVPAGVAATPNVHYDYDENGNRTFMSDGLGTVSYSYNQLSQMLSETRYFGPQPGEYNAALPGTYELSYDYNLAGQVNRISYSSSVRPSDNSYTDYSYNKVGETLSVTSSPFAGITNMVAGMQYRAWGASKSQTFGNNLTSAATYDNRLQIQGLRYSNQSGTALMDKTYHYYLDGKIKFSDDNRTGNQQYYQRFDRAFRYDQVGRLEEALTGSQARNYIDGVPIGTETVPYHLTYQYDVWGNQLSQSGKIWSEDINDSAIYQNLRKDGWQYDAAGNVINDGLTPYQYDAAGRNAQVGLTTGVDSTQTFDGDGLVGRRDPYMPEYDFFSSSPIFYLRSSVLGGKVIVEINGMGTNAIWTIPRGGKLRNNVYNGETRIAIHDFPTQSLIWKYVIDPITGSTGNVSPDGTYLSFPNEPDPSGISVGMVDPAEIPPPPPEPETPNYESGENWNPFQPKFTLDGISIPAALASIVISSGSAVVAPAEEYITVIRHGRAQLARWQAYADGYQGYVPVGERYLGGGVLSFGGGGLSRRAPGGLSDTDLAAINGATGEAELGLGLEWQRTPRVPGNKNKGSRPRQKKPSVVPPPVDPALKSPCYGKNASDLDYNRVRTYNSGHTESARDHILRNHTVSARAAVSPYRLAMLAGYLQKSLYGSNPPLVPTVMFDNIRTTNAATFSFGRFDVQRDASQNVTQIVFTYEFPTTFGPDGKQRENYVGIEFFHGNVSSSKINTLILDPDCVGVQTSFPGRR